MPPKPKIHGKSGKLKSLPQKIVPVAGNSAGLTSNDESSLQTPHADPHFELELCWCIQQLEISLENKKLNPKQTQETQQILKVLKNNSQPIVRKRQLMRMHFGDYRSTMAKEEKKAKKVNDHISFMNRNMSSTKSTFLRKSTFLGDNSFRFNFKHDDKGGDSTGDEAPKEKNIKKELDTDLKNFYSVQKLNFSNEEFKFNFIINENV